MSFLLVGRGTGWKNTFNTVVINSGGGTGGGAFLGSLTYYDQTNSAQAAGVPIHFVWPIASNAPLAPGTILAVFNSGVPLPVQQDFTCSEMSGNVRWIGATALTNAAIPASGSLGLTVTTTGSGQVSGTPITVTDVLNTDCNVNITVTMQSGDVYTGTLRDVLLASSTWAGTNNGGQSYFRGYTRQGPYVMACVGSLALKQAGTAHNFLRVETEATFVKAQTSAVSGGNPITQARVDLMFEQGYLYVPNPVDLAYGVNITVGSASPVTGLSWPILSPNALLTASSVTSGSTTFTASINMFTKDTLGAIFEAAGNISVINTYTSGSVVKGTNTFQQQQANFSQTIQTPVIPAATYGSNLWRVIPINHVYGTRWDTTVWWQNNNDHLSLPDPNSLRSTKGFLNWATPAASWPPPNTSALYALSESTTPVAAKRPFSYTNGRFCSQPLDVNTAGQSDTDYINVLPAWGIQLLTAGAWNTDSVRLLRETNCRYGIITLAFSDESTGGMVDYVNRPTVSMYHTNSGLIKFTNSTRNPIYWRYGYQDTSHIMEPTWPAWLLGGGQYKDLRWLQQKQQWDWMNAKQSADLNGFTATGVQRNGLTHGNQQRGAAWEIRDLISTVSVTPDIALPGMRTKSQFKLVVQSMWSYAVGTVMTNSVWDVSKNHFASIFPGNTMFGSQIEFSPWQHSYQMFTMAWATEHGMLDAQGERFLPWLASAPVQWTRTDGEEAGNCPSDLTSFDFDVIDQNSRAAPTTWLYANTMSSTYQNTANDWTYGYDANYSNIGIISITPLSGSAITVVLSSGYFLGNFTQSFSVGGYVRAYNSPSRNFSVPTAGCGQITAIAPDGKTLTVTTNSGGIGGSRGMAFTTTAFSGNRMYLNLREASIAGPYYYAGLQAGGGGSYQFKQFSVMNWLAENQISGAAKAQLYLLGQMISGRGVAGGMPTAAGPLSIGGAPQGFYITARSSN